ncbi:MAG: BamA/TamA family outer membrane protein [Roseivirga sp.]|uniref:translocation and assembly module lipoprotein TamL n=1 Tax=Roseivirga sp. TaxID=1964215 RepID=UPI001B2E9277|nr:BamA/TamA family outer membrane protein [Roseivirga sp.]MBO6661468.1 BamA/TamA family outer membrane protein [Roseivirga sp.]MBO6908548.1 BamA/TamA family outer membrane protein [Roseivirga sp.]
MKLKATIGLLIALTFISSCSVRRFVPEDKYLLRSASVSMESEEKRGDLGEVSSELNAVLKPQPNSVFLGMRLGLLYHYKAQREKPGFIIRYLNKKFGEEPVYLSDLDSARIIELLDNRLENNGFFHSNVSSKTKIKRHLASVNFKAELGKPYELATYQLDSTKGSVFVEIDSTLSETLFPEEARFNLDLLKAERQRIDKRLKSRGYYNFNEDFLIFEADTNQYDNRKFDLFLRLKNDVPRKSLLPYTLEEINVFPDYSLNQEKTENDTITLNGINFIQNPVFFKPKRMEPYILLHKGQTYNPDTSRLTSSRLSSIGAYRFVNIRYESINPNDTTSDTLKLKANIFLSPLKKRSVRAELQAVTKSNGFAGPAMALVYSNRNLFKGGETFNLTGNLGYEVQLGSGGTTTGLSSTQFGFKAGLIVPRLLLPFNINDRYLYSVPKTSMSVGFDFFDRSELYSLRSLNLRFGYNWRKNRAVYHEVNPISVDYVNTSNVSPEFQEILDQNRFLQSSFQKQLIAGVTYTFVWNQLALAEKRNPILLVANVDIAGSGLDLLSNKTNDEGKETLFGTAYAQYAKADFNFVYNYRLSSSQRIVARLFGGYGLPYGNSETLPFARQFFSGGPSSVRAFRTRSLGPGTYNPSDADQGSFFDRSGDIRLEANIEYRFPIYSFLKGALFADAGNVWLTKENSDLPGGKFSSDFINELGVGVGAGMRVDIQNFVIRFDLATPLSKPYLPRGERFSADFKEFLFNFAIGYPF